MTKNDKSKCADIILEINSLGAILTITPDEVTIIPKKYDFNHTHFSLDKGLLHALRLALIYTHERAFDEKV